MSGRLPKYREFLRTLSEVLDLEGAVFAKALGKKPTNVSQYLSGTKKVGIATVRRGVTHLAEWNVTPLLEVEPKPPSLAHISTAPGIYALYDSSASVVYLGQAKNLRSEIRQTLNRKANFPVRVGPHISRKRKPRYRDITTRISVYEVPSARLRHNLEALLLRLFPNQIHNDKLGRFR
jgi:hypothetical protein